MPTRAERAAQHQAPADVDMAVLGKAAQTAPKLKGSIGDGGATARRKPDISEIYSPPRITAVAAKHGLQP
eukprot:7573495-Heterocapsa_arctica.AAC.1